MAWKKELVTIVRILVNDLNQPFVYSDNRLQQVIVVAAHFVKTDLSFGGDYRVYITQPDIIPDPTEPNGKDEPFVNSVALKAACLIDQSTFRSKAAMEGITAALGPASLSVGGNLEGFRILLNEGPCALYEKFVSDFEIANATNIRAILSPFVGNRFDPEMLPYTNDRGRNLYS
jgi:hypothetical protein